MTKKTRLIILVTVAFALLVSIVALIVSIQPSEEEMREYQAYVVENQSRMKKIAKALMIYKRWCKKYPSNERGLEELAKPIECKDTTSFIRPIPLDTWANNFKYENKGDTYLLYSAGSDKEKGGSYTAADIHLENK